MNELLPIIRRQRRPVVPPKAEMLKAETLNARVEAVTSPTTDEPKPTPERKDDEKTPAKGKSR
jgi:hypothetical protein